MVQFVAFARWPSAPLGNVINQISSPIFQGQFHELWIIHICAGERDDWQTKTATSSDFLIF